MQNKKNIQKFRRTFHLRNDGDSSVGIWPTHIQARITIEFLDEPSDFTAEDAKEMEWEIGLREFANNCIGSEECETQTKAEFEKEMRELDKLTEGQE